MQFLVEFCPVLIGSVWRGTIKRESDIDIAVYSDNPEQIFTTLKARGIKITRTNWTRVNKRGSTLESFHIYGETTNKHILEIVLKKKKKQKRRDDAKSLAMN